MMFRMFVIQKFSPQVMGRLLRCIVTIILQQQCLDILFSLFVSSFADMHIADVTLFIDQI